MMADRPSYSAQDHVDSWLSEAYKAKLKHISLSAPDWNILRRSTREASELTIGAEGEQVLIYEGFHWHRDELTAEDLTDEGYLDLTQDQPYLMRGPWTPSKKRAVTR